MATIAFNSPIANRELVGNGSRSIAYWIPNGINIDTGVGFSGAHTTGKNPKGIGALCTMESMDAIPMEALTSETYRWVGKQALRFTTGGRIPEFNIMIDSGDTKTLRVMLGKDTNSATANVFVPRVDAGASGHLLVRTWAVGGGLQRSVLVPNLSVKFGEVVGTGAPDDRLMQTVTFYKDGDAEIFITEGSKTFGVAFWKLISGGAGTGVPATAPDGVIANFVVGTGNVNGVAGATSPVPLKLDDEFVAAKYGATATDLEKYWVGVWKSGIQQTSSQVTYTTGTRTIGFGSTPPLITDSVLGVYVYNTATALAENVSNSDTTIVEYERFPWPSY